MFSVLFVGLVLLLRSGARAGGSRPTTADLPWVLLAGICLAGHFWAFFAALRLTTIASAVVLVSLQPVFVGALSAMFLREPPTGRQWGGIGIAVLGASILGWGDLGLSPTALLGDALAIAGAALGASYFVLGRRLRRTLDLWEYVGLVYGAAAVVLVVAAAAAPGARLTGFPALDWWVFVLMAAGPMMLGHTGLNYAIRYVPAYLANLAMLAEPVGATFLAWIIPAIAETPSGNALIGGGIVILGIAIGSLPSRSG